MESILSSPSPERLHCWRLFFESALALIDPLDSEPQQALGIPQRLAAYREYLPTPAERRRLLLLPHRSSRGIKISRWLTHFTWQPGDVDIR